MPEDLHRAFLKRARSEDRTGAQVVREAIRRYVEDEAPAPAAKLKAPPKGKR
jgi:predicted DNA-binding protein